MLLTLEDCQLPLFLLFLSLVVRAKDCLIHNSCQKKYFLHFLFCWHLTDLILEGNGDFGFEEAWFLFFLFRSGHIIIVAKLISIVKFCTIDFFTGFDPSD